MSLSPLSYIGGKSLLAKRIISEFADHETYCEVFCGAAHVFFTKDESKYEVINDINSDLITFYKVLKYHLDEFVKQFRWMLSSREWWEEYKRQLDAGGLTDIQRSARYFYMQKQSFGGKVNGRTFGAGALCRPKINLLRLEESLSEAHLRLARATIEHLPYGEFLSRYDRPSTLFYIDPPYWGCEDFYGKGIFGREDFQALAGQLAGIKGRFVLSLNDVPDVRVTFKAFTVIPVTTRYSCSKSANTQAREVVIKNF